MLAGLILALLALKAVQEGWFTPRPLPELRRQPALVFFTLSRGCECQMTVVHSAEAQLDTWDLPVDLGLNVVHVDLNLQRDLARQFGVARAPALVLIDSRGRVVWKQDVGLSDEAPLDLNQVEVQIETLMQNP